MESATVYPVILDKTVPNQFALQVLITTLPLVSAYSPARQEPTRISTPAPVYPVSLPAVNA